MISYTLHLGLVIHDEKVDHYMIDSDGFITVRFHQKDLLFFG